MLNMRYLAALGFAAAAAISFAAPGYARNTVYMLKVTDAEKDPEFAAQVPIDVDFYFKSQAVPAGATALGDVEVHLKRRRPEMVDERNCHMAFVAVLNALREKAIAAGGNAVSNIVSYYKQQPSGSETEFQCNAGATGGIVWLKGTIQKVPR